MFDFKLLVGKLPCLCVFVTCLLVIEVGMSVNYRVLFFFVCFLFLIFICINFVPYPGTRY